MKRLYEVIEKRDSHSRPISAVTNIRSPTLPRSRGRATTTCRESNGRTIPIWRAGSRQSMSVPGSRRRSPKSPPSSRTARPRPTTRRTASSIADVTRGRELSSCAPIASWPGSSRPFCYVLLLRRNRLLDRRRFLGLVGLAIGLAQELVEELGALLLILRFLCFLRLPLFGEPVIVHFPAHRILHPWWRDRCQRGATSRSSEPLAGLPLTLDHVIPSVERATAKGETLARSIRRQPCNPGDGESAWIGNRNRAPPLAGRRRRGVLD